MCEHKNFVGNITVNRLGHPVIKYMADVTIKCADCGLPFKFQGLLTGVSVNTPTRSLDHREARLPITPSEDVIDVTNALLGNKILCKECGIIPVAKEGEICNNCEFLTKNKSK